MTLHREQEIGETTEHVRPDGAELWVAGNPAAYQELAQPYLAGFGAA